MSLQGSMNTRTTTVLKDPDGNIIETGIVDMIESKGLEFTYDAEGNIILVKRPVPKPDPRIRYTLLEGQHAQRGPWIVINQKVHTAGGVKFAISEDSESVITQDPESDSLVSGLKKKHHA